MSYVRPAHETAAHGEPWARLLEGFYERLGLEMPALERLQGEDMPQPGRDLLVHSRDMTPTLEAFYHQPIGLRVLSRHTAGHEYFREVVLDAGGQPVEYGVIRILLDHLPNPVREKILGEHSPLGAILIQEGLPHFGWPQAFFAVTADSRMQEALGLSEPCVLHGRRNVLLDGNRRLLAEVIEILAPALPE